MRRNWKKAGLIAAAVLALLAAVAWLLFENVFVTRNVVIAGNVAAAADEIIRAAHPEMGGSIFRIDEGRLKASLESGGRYALDDVSVQYPDTLMLTVRERTRDALIPSGGQVLVTDSDGYVIEVLPSLPAEGGVYVRGLNSTGYSVGRRITAPEKQLEAMKAVLEAIRSTNAGAYLSEINVEDPLNLSMISRTGIEIKLGDKDRMEDKLLWTCSAIADLESRGEIVGTLDVTSGTMADFRSSH